LVREFDISLLVGRLFRDKHLDGAPLRIRKEAAESSDVSRAIDGLLTKGLLQSPADIPYSGLFESPGETLPAEQVVCFMDPLCYLSHLSAMQWYGITDRRPKPIQISSPRGTLWTTKTGALMASALTQSSWTGGEPTDSIVRGRFAWRNFPSRIRGHAIERYQDSYWQSANYDEASGLRVSTVGRTYLDMIRSPGQCGGIRHVLDVFEEHGRRHRNLIVREVNEFGTKLDKSRVGYILDEMLGVDVDSSPTLTTWLSTAVQRGGSRKLDPDADYAPVFSERWCLSLNI